jgi:cobalt/nickel transport system permease protein
LHIPDNLLDLKTCAATAVASAAAIGFALRRIDRGRAQRLAPLMGVVAASLFAAQMMNLPIPGGTSGHLLGGVLAAVMLGPWNGLLVLTVVLAVQCVLFQDGGASSLGANILNVGVIGSVVGYAIFEPIRRAVGGQKGTVFGAVVAAWFSVVLGATACSIEIALSGKYQLAPALGVMLLIHSVIGLGEAAITGLAISYILRTRADLVYGEVTQSGMLARSGQVVLAGLALAIVIAVFLSPFASQLPDGLDATLARLGIDPDSVEPFFAAPMPDYGLGNLRFAGSVAGGIGTLVVFALAFLLARGLSSKSSIAHTPHAS